MIARCRCRLLYPFNKEIIFRELLFVRAFKYQLLTILHSYLRDWIFFSFRSVIYTRAEYTSANCPRLDSKIFPDRRSPSTTDLCLRFSNFPKTLYHRDNSSDMAKLATEYVSSGDTRIACHHNEAICEIDGAT